jgi:hypothetical protein
MKRLPLKQSVMCIDLHFYFFTGVMFSSFYSREFVSFSLQVVGYIEIYHDKSILLQVL